MRTGYLSDDSTTTIRYLDRTVIPHIRPGCAYGGHNSPYFSALSESDFDFAMSSDADAAAETVALFQNLSVQAARQQLYQRLLLPGSLGCVQAVLVNLTRLSHHSSLHLRHPDHARSASGMLLDR